MSDDLQTTKTIHTVVKSTNTITDIKDVTTKSVDNLSKNSQYKLNKTFGVCCISAKQGVGHSDYCKNSPYYNKNILNPDDIDKLPNDPFAFSGY